jgi:hypothetical protein
MFFWPTYYDWLSKVINYYSIYILNDHFKFRKRSNQFNIEIRQNDHIHIVSHFKNQICLTLVLSSSQQMYMFLT